jgi:hypothetical protein
MIVIRLIVQTSHLKTINLDPFSNLTDNMIQIDQTYLISFIELQTQIHHKEIMHGIIEMNQLVNYFRHC